MVEKRTFYRIGNKHTYQGVWYNIDGEFVGLIHNIFDFCQNNELQMDYDPEIVGYLSVADNLDTLYYWFPIEDIIKLQGEGWEIQVYETDDYKFYERHQHYIINKNNSKLIQTITLK